MYTATRLVFRKATSMAASRAPSRGRELLSPVRKILPCKGASIRNSIFQEAPTISLNRLRSSTNAIPLGAPSSVLEGGAFSSARLDSASLQIHCIDSRQSCFGFRVKRETAPRPVLRVPHEPSHHRIRVHVLQFFLFLLVTVHVEIDLPVALRTESYNIGIKEAFSKGFARTSWNGTSFSICAGRTSQQYRAF